MIGNFQFPTLANAKISLVLEKGRPAILGFVQLPAEASVFGVRFTFYRNILTLISTILVAYLTVVTVKAFL